MIVWYNPRANNIAQRKYYRCHLERNKARVERWRTDHPEYGRANKRAEYARDRDKFTARMHNRRARLAGASGSLTAEDVKFIRSVSNRCIYCGKKRPLTLDHKTPLTRGGVNRPRNIHLACRPCNDKKGERTHREYMRIIK